jgi:microcystin-dependent protein
VNDSARAGMARTAEYRDDISGGIVTSGSSTAYAVSSYQVFDTLAHLHTQMIAFTPHTTCGAPVTLNVDGLGAKPLRFSPGTELPAGTLVQGTPYVATYNNTDGAFYLQQLAGNPYNIPLGGMIEFTGAVAPNGSFVLPFGQAISRATYAAYFAMIGTTYGAGDGSTTFNVIDKRGRVSAGKDDMGGSAAGRIGSVVTDSGTIVGTTLGSVGGSATHAQTSSEVGLHNHGVTDPGHTHTTVGNHISILTGSTPSASVLSIGGGDGTGNSTTGISINNNSGGGNAMSLLQPTVIVNYILRVL